MSRKGGPGWESESDKQFIVKVKVKTDWLESKSKFGSGYNLFRYKVVVP